MTSTIRCSPGSTRTTSLSLMQNWYAWICGTSRTTSSGNGFSRMLRDTSVPTESWTSVQRGAACSLITVSRINRRFSGASWSFDDVFWRTDVEVPVVARPDRGITLITLWVLGSMITISSRTTVNYLPRNSGLIRTMSGGTSTTRTERGSELPTETSTFTLVFETFCFSITWLNLLCTSGVAAAFDPWVLVELWLVPDPRFDPAWLPWVVPDGAVWPCCAAGSLPRLPRSPLAGCSDWPVVERSFPCGEELALGWAPDFWPSGCVPEVPEDWPVVPFSMSLAPDFFISWAPDF